MLLYLIIVLISGTIMFLLQLFCNPMHLAWWAYLLWEIIFIVAAFLLDALVALIIRRCMPEKWFEPHKKFFHTSRAEMKFYNLIKVGLWKNFIPEWGGFTHFRKNKVASPFDNEYIGQYMLEASYGIAIHLFSVPFSFLIIFLDWRMWSGGNLWYTMGIPIALMNAFLIVLPAFVLKYNLPRLIRIYDGNVRLQQKNAQKVE